MKSERIKYWLVAFLALGILLTFVSVQISSDNVTYGVEQLHQYDTSLFRGNTLISDHSPRLLLNMAVAALMRILNVSWFTVMVLLLYCTAIPYAFAIANFGSRLFKGYEILIGIILLLLLFLNAASGLAGFQIAIGSFGMCAGTGFAIWGISYAIGEKASWNKAWLLMAVAAACHVHEGMWGGACLAGIYLIYIIVDKQKICWRDLLAACVWLGVILLSTLPTVLLSDPLTISNAEFVQIYVRERTPHHLLISSFGLKNIVLHLLLLLYPAFLYAIYMKSKKKPYKVFLIKSGFLIGTWVLALVFEYVFTEIIPKAFVPTMYPTKYFRYISILAVIWYGKLIYESLKERQLEVAACVLWFAFSAKNMGFWSLLAILLVVFVMKAYADSDKTYAFPATILLLLICSTYMLHPSARTCALVALICAIGLIEAMLHNRMKKVMLILCVLTCFGVASYGRLYIFAEGEIRVLKPNDYLLQTVSPGIVSLSNWFEKNTEKDEMFLCNPEDLAGAWFQVLAKRNCYNQFKTTPSSSARVKQWYDDWQNTRGLFWHPIEEIIDLMKNINCKWILVPADRCEMFEISKYFTLMAAEEDYSIFMLQ